MRKSTSVLVTLMSIACVANAWQTGKPDGAKFEPEPSQEVIQKQQLQYQKVIGEVGDTHHEDETSVDVTTNEHDQTAANNVSGTASSDAAKVLVQSDADIHQVEKGNGWLGIFLVGLCLSVVLGVRTWANKNIPIVGSDPVKKPKS